MLRILGLIFRKEPVLVGFSSKLLEVIDTGTTAFWSEVPNLSYQLDSNGEKVTVSIGNAAKSSDGIVENPFSHPRLLIGDWLVAEMLITRVFRTINTGLGKFAKPIVIFYVKDRLEGGLTNIELRALYELMWAVRAREIYFWPDRTPPSEQQILAKTYKQLDSSREYPFIKR